MCYLLLSHAALLGRMNWPLASATTNARNAQMDLIFLENEKEKFREKKRHIRNENIIESSFRIEFQCLTNVLQLTV